eukprot:1896124-Amphidinium_carterae.2
MEECRHMSPMFFPQEGVARERKTKITMRLARMAQRAPPMPDCCCPIMDGMHPDSMRQALT